MGQTFSLASSNNNNNNNNNDDFVTSRSSSPSSSSSLSTRLLTSPGSARQSFMAKRVHSEDVDAGGIGGARRASSTSRSLPTSPSVRKRLSDSYGLESVLKNLEELAQQHTNQLQWPTWVRRRGWFASNQAGTGQPSAAEVAAPPSAAVVDDGSGRMVQVDKDKWVFQRHRKKAGPPTLFSPVDDADESGLLDRAEGDSLPLADEVVPGNGQVAAGGEQQRSRRSSGYASASSSPTSVAKRLVIPVPQEEPTAVMDSPPVAAGSLYEVTLRWMFDGSVVEPEDPLPVEEMSPPEEESDGSSWVRIHVHLFRREQHRLASKAPSHVDFLPEDSEKTSFAIRFQDGISPPPSTSVPRETACLELIRRIASSHPLLNEYYGSGKLALYEKTWRPGKTSRARLRRLNDFDCPLVLACQWSASVAGSDDDADPPVGCARTLVLQESQNGDIPWEDFTVAELSSFLRVLDREEAHHELEIRRRYELLGRQLRHAMDLHQEGHHEETSGNGEVECGA